MDISDDVLALELIETSTHPAHKVPTWFFRMVDPATRAQVGRINLRPSLSDHVRLYAGQIGYEVTPEHRGHRYAARAVSLLLWPARELGLCELWITCDPENLASRCTCERAGAELIEIIDVPKDCIIHRLGHLRKCRYRLIL